MHSCQFTDAIVRRPGSNIAAGLRATDRGQPSIEDFLVEHDEYIACLEKSGLNVRVLPPLDPYPDSVFVEDAALCFPEGTVILRPGAPSRTGETEDLAIALTSLGHVIHHIAPGGFVDGGDVLVTDAVILVGLSSRTDHSGFTGLADLLSDWGYAVRAVHTPGHVLHFKSDCCLLDNETVLATSRLSTADCFSNFKVLIVPDGEEAAANSIRVNETVLVPAGFPATSKLLLRERYKVEEVPVSQAALLDGGLSCMSLRY